jgi:hypothetical protein
MMPLAKMRFHTLAAASAAMALRLFFVLKFPFTDDSDSRIYDQLARNLAAHHIYGLRVFGHLQAADVRVPGYPIFLDLTWSTGRHHWPMPGAYAQILVDLVTCFLAAGIATRLAPRESRDRAWIAGLWLSALCPFVANYCTVELTEVLAVFFTALTLWLLLWPGGITEIPAGNSTTIVRTALLAGIAAGCGALVRPETPLAIIAALPAAGEMAHAVAYGLPAGLRDAAAAGSLGHPERPYAARSAVPEPTRRGAAGGICGARSECMDGDVDVADAGRL